jgi:BirA family biotin operon repressor/biotin-[acetyl-CoA-carboxylase] ligase
VYLGEHKVAGILTELVDPGHMIVGMGVNVSHSATELPLESATSLALHGINIDPVTLAQEWLSGFMELVDVLGTPGTLDHLRSRMGLMGDEVVVDMPDSTTVEGTVTALAPTGELIVSNGSGNHTILAGEIQRLRRRS